MPQWGDSDIDSQAIQVKTEVNHVSNDDMNTSLATGWPISTDLVLLPGKPLAILTQLPVIKAILHCTINAILKKLTFKHGFPSSDAHTMHSHDAVLKAAEDLRYRDIANRIQNDIDYINKLAAYVSVSIMSL